MGLIWENDASNADARVHWDGCWRDHLDCAVRRVEELLDERRKSGKFESSVMRMAEDCGYSISDGDPLFFLWETLTEDAGRRALLDRALGLLREAYFDSYKSAIAQTPANLTLHCTRSVLAWDQDRQSLLRDAGDGEEG